MCSHAHIEFKTEGFSHKFQGFSHAEMLCIRGRVS